MRVFGVRMLSVRSGLAAVAAGLVLGLVSGLGAAQAADAAHGKILFTQKYGCYQCHGTVGQGGQAGPRLAPNPIPFETLSTFVRTSSGPMPPFRESVLPNGDLADIYAYLQSIPAGPSYKDIPLLNQ
jgi:mono/diheme cytochrome c family protein